MAEYSSICGQESVIARIGDDIKLLAFEDLYDIIPEPEECLDEELDIRIKRPEEVYVLDRGTQWTRVNWLRKSRNKKPVMYVKINGIDGLIVSSNHPLIVSNDVEDTVEAAYITSSRRQFRDSQLDTRFFAGEKDHIDVDFMDHVVSDGYCYNNYKGFYHTCHKKIDLDEGVKVSLLGYYVGLFILDGNYVYDPWGNDIGISVPCANIELAEELAKGVYRATGIAIEVIPGKKEGDPVLLYTENVAMLKLMRDKFGLKENTLERKLPEDIIVYPKKFQLGVVDAFLEGDPFHPYKVEPTYKKHGRKLSTQFAILARVAGLEGRVAFREGNHPAQYPRCGYIINWKALPFYYDITDEWRQIVKVAPISNRTFLEQNEHMYEIYTESHSLLINNIWTYN